MKTEIYATQYIYRVEDKAIATIHRFGNKGIINGMLGKDLLKNLLKDLLEGNIKALGIKILEGYVSREVSIAIKHTVSKQNNIVITLSDKCHADNRDSIWIKVEVK